MNDVRVSVGGATDVGRLRDQNQDSILLGPVLYGVADGMGGHQGGEVASSLAVDVIRTHLSELDPVTTDAVRAAVVEANRAVFERSGTDPTVAGMGTTIVGVALVDDGDGRGQRIVVLNVGDSRAYRFRDGALTQVSVDHSLVGELLRDGRITPEEADVHPQRNVVTRVLGIEENVVVDAFHFPPRGGDRYLLCSDGLTNEVPEDDIATVLTDVADPDEAAAELVRQANVNGGRDNITVVVVDVDAPAVPDGVVPDADDFSHHGGSDTESYDPLAHTGDAPSEERERRRGPRVVTLRSIAFVVVVLALLGGVAYLVTDYASNSYFVGIDDERVAVFKGRPGGFLWIEPEVREVIDDIDLDDMRQADRLLLEDGVVRSSLADALAWVDDLRERTDEFIGPVTPTTTTSPPETRPDGTTTTKPGG